MKQIRFRAVRPGRAATALAGALGATLAVAACGGSGSTAADSNGVTTITVGIPAAVTADAVQIAQDNGYFRQHHLKVDIKTLNGGAGTVPALQSGAIQVAQSNVLSEIQGAAHGLAVPCFAGAFDLTDPGTGNVGLIPLVAGARSGITKPSDLAGKTIALNATGGVNQLMMDAWLKQQGVDFHSVHYIAMEFPDMPQAITAGRVDAAVMVEPFGTQVVHQGARLISGYLEGNIQGHPIFSCWNGSADWLKKNAAAARNFIAAITQANDFINNQPDQFRTWLQKNSQIPAAVIKDIALPRFTTDMSNADVTGWEKAAQAYGIVTGPSVDTADVYAPISGS
ncbi:MAG TPA: ABC transporter substrate-binding protein [Streptosporangiaceae bacterium]|nr:ABC transporter substrate-binding protein [Streptosporangiaceae bacterium]